MTCPWCAAPNGTPAVLLLFDDRIIWPSASRMASRQRHLGFWLSWKYIFVLNITMSYDVMVLIPGFVLVLAIIIFFFFF
jgi:hypothetical protein